MADPFSFIDNQTFLPIDVVDGGIFTSADQNNSTGGTFSSLRVVADFHDLQAGPGQKVSITTLIEGRSTSTSPYFALAQQFDPFDVPATEQQRIIVLQSDLFWNSPGIDNILFIAGEGVIAQVSNQQGTLSPFWRVRVRFNDPGGNFISVRMSLHGERY